MSSSERINLFSPIPVELASLISNKIYFLLIFFSKNEKIYLNHLKIQKKPKNFRPIIYSDFNLRQSLVFGARITQVTKIEERPNEPRNCKFSTKPRIDIDGSAKANQTEPRGSA